MKKKGTGILCAVLIIALTAYLMADTFLIRRSYEETGTLSSTDAFQQASDNLSSDATDTSTVSEQDESEDTQPQQLSGSTGSHSSHSGHHGSSHGSSDSASSSSSSSSSSSGSGSSSSTGVLGEYEDDNIRITVTEYTVEDTRVYAADITVSSAEYLKTAFAEATYGRNITETTSQMAEDNDAILAVNGDYYGAQESGYVIRNGQVYRNTSSSDTDICCIYADGSMQIRNTGEVTAEELAEEGVWQAFSFGPALIENGEVAVSEGDEVGKAMASNPRTAIGLIDENHYVFVVSDGRTEESEGLSLSELAEFMQTLGVECAYNLDGGGSSTMVFEGTVINNPTTSGNSIKERSVSDIVYIG